MRVVVVVPTYNERENIAALIGALRALGIPGLRVLVVDDASPDGTSAAAEEAGKGAGDVVVLTRRADRGRGRAGREGFLRALAMGADRIVEMDADFSHEPRDLPSLLGALDDGAQIALGSRFVSGGAQKKRGAIRRAITRLANAYIRGVFGIAVRDPNSGYRAYTREALEAIDPATLTSPGPAIVQEVLFRASRRGLRIVERPIVFVNRERGRSKLGIVQLAQGYWAVLRLRLGELVRGPRRG